MAGNHEPRELACVRLAHSPQRRKIRLRASLRYPVGRGGPACSTTMESSHNQVVDVSRKHAASNGLEVRILPIPQHRAIVPWGDG